MDVITFNQFESNMKFMYKIHESYRYSDINEVDLLELKEN